MQAEALGFESLWASDQVVIPSRLASFMPYTPSNTYDVEANQNFYEATAGM